MPEPEMPPPLTAAKKLTLLRRLHAKLFVEREHMVINVKRNIMAGFQKKLGTHEHAMKKAEWEVGRLKRELELVRGYAGQGDVDYDRIAGALDDEFEPQEQELEAAPRKLEWANQRLNSMMSLEQTAAYQSRYRRLAERLHPDLRFDRSTTAANLWDRIREAYANGDAVELEGLELLAEALSPENLEARPAAELEERAGFLMKANEKAINEISSIRQEWPFPLAAKLPDEAWLKSQREEYEVKTSRLLAEREKLAAELNRLLDTRPSEIS
jgi:hypothetical protein